MPCGTKFLREFFVFSADWRFFLVLRELIFVIRTDWFFSLRINFGKYLAEVHARETRFFFILMKHVNSFRTEQFSL